MISFEIALVLIAFAIGIILSIIATVEFLILGLRRGWWDLDLARTSARIQRKTFEVGALPQAGATAKTTKLIERRLREDLEENMMQLVDSPLGKQILETFPVLREWAVDRPELFKRAFPRAVKLIEDRLPAKLKKYIGGYEEDSEAETQEKQDESFF